MHLARRNAAELRHSVRLGRDRGRWSSRSGPAVADLGEGSDVDDGHSREGVRTRVARVSRFALAHRVPKALSPPRSPFTYLEVVLLSTSHCTSFVLDLYPSAPNRSSNHGSSQRSKLTPELLKLPSHRHYLGFESFISLREHIHCLIKGTLHLTLELLQRGV